MLAIELEVEYDEGREQDRDTNGRNALEAVSAGKCTQASIAPVHRRVRTCGVIV